MTKSRNLLGVLAGQASLVAILALVLVLSIVGAPMLQQKKAVATKIGGEVAIAKAQAISEAMLSGTSAPPSSLTRPERRAISGVGTTFPASSVSP